eukprot:6201140-Pleurochrysis_carterae.AAC.5
MIDCNLVYMFVSAPVTISGVLAALLKQRGSLDLAIAAARVPSEAGRAAHPREFRPCCNG